MNKKRFRDNMKVGFFNPCVVKNEVWFAVDIFNGLGCINLQNGQMEYIAEIPGENMSNFLLYSDIVRYEEYLILVPYSAKEIAVYNLIEKNFTKISLKEPILKDYYIKDGKFRKAIVAGDSVYLIPYYYPAIVELNMKSENLTYYDEWVEELHNKGKMQYGYSTYNPVLIDEIIYIATAGTNILIEFNIENKKTILTEMKEADQFSGMAKTEHQWLLAERLCGQFIFYDNREKKQKTFEFPKEVTKEIVTYSICGLEVIDVDTIYALCYDATLFKIDIINESITVVKKGSGKIVYPWERIWIYNRSLFCYSGKNSMLEEYSGTGSLIKKTRLTISEDFFNRWIESILQEQRYEYYKFECFENTLSKYLLFLNISHDNKQKIEIGQNIGNSIFKELLTL